MRPNKEISFFFRGSEIYLILITGISADSLQNLGNLLFLRSGVWNLLRSFPLIWHFMSVTSVLRRVYIIYDIICLRLCMCQCLPPDVYWDIIICTKHQFYKVVNCYLSPLLMIRPGFYPSQQDKRWWAISVWCQSNVPKWRMSY